jgi:hypothetical protein
MAFPFPLPPPPNFRVAKVEPTHIRLTWSDYPAEFKTNRRLLGYRLYKSAVKDELGKRLSDERILGPGTFQYDDNEPDAGPERFYTIIAVEIFGWGEGPFGIGPYGQPDSGGFDLMPFNSRPWSSPVRGWGEAPFGIEPFGF